MGFAFIVIAPLTMLAAGVVRETPEPNLRYQTTAHMTRDEATELFGERCNRCARTKVKLPENVDVPAFRVSACCVAPVNATALVTVGALFGMANVKAAPTLIVVGHVNTPLVA